MDLPDYIGRYILRRQIARGGFAVVVLAWDDELAAEVAIKILDFQSEDHDGLKHRFIEEARLLRRIRSHSLVNVHDVGRLGDGCTPLIMDGTPAYMAPEQYAADGEVTPAADVFSATAVLWHAAGGERPPNGSSNARNWWPI